ncbi:MAG: pyruvate dehydrogenase [Verrucomicrobia bacterium]|nr:MAG: pyruvate dehydrogenase [Verrucomicrobiota bacterium]
MTQKTEIEASDKVVAAIEKRVLWLAVQIVHHANRVRANVDGVHVGGHQSSSASVVTILTALYLEYLQSGDLISIKPHASPVFHAIQYLIGNLDEDYLRTLRQLGGLQAYPSRTKDPDPVDFSTGSVGLGAVAPNFASLVAAYNQAHGFGRPASSARFVSLLGDAELDEGAVWEAIAEPVMHGLDNILWVVDLNRQSLDRVIPGIRVRSWREMFAANGWHVIDVKYGARLKSAFLEPNGDLLRDCIDGLSNEAYQNLLRLPPADLRRWLPRKGRFPDDLKRLLDRWSDDELHGVFGNLGGHDHGELRNALRQVKERSGPAIIFAYTMKGWNLPSMAHPLNHSVLLDDSQVEALREKLGIAEDARWSRFEEGSPEDAILSQVGQRMHGASPPVPNAAESGFGADLNVAHRGMRSSQQAFGVLLTAISREHPALADRILTMSPDVASSTNLGGWINKTGVWRRSPVEELPEPEERRSLKWTESSRGRHIELGISENNLFMALGQFGLSHEMFGETLFPVGTLYDPFVRRGLDAFFYSLYAGAKFIVVGTPSGVTLASEGGIHQSLLTPSIGTELPEIAFYEPCFGQELEWILLDALESLRRRGRSAYLRLTTRPVDQALFSLPDDSEARERLRLEVLQGAYRLRDARDHPGYAPGTNVVHIFTCGSMVPEALAALEALAHEGIHANLFNVTGPGPLYRRFHDAMRSAVDGQGDGLGLLGALVPADERDVPVVTVIDGHPHALSWIGGALGTRVWPLGVVAFGQSGNVPEVHRSHHIDSESIAATCRRALIS